MRTMLGFAALSANLQEPAGECEGRRRQNVGWVDPGTCSGRSPTASATTLVASGIDACDVGLRCAQRQPTKAQPTNAKADEGEMWVGLIPELVPGEAQRLLPQHWWRAGLMPAMLGFAALSANLQRRSRRMRRPTKAKCGLG